LGVVARFSAAGPAGGSGLGAAKVFGARKFVATVIDHIMAGESWRHEGLYLGNLYLHGDCGKNQKRLHHVGGNHDAEGNQSKGRFARQAALGAHQGWAYGRDELMPGRGPLDQQLGSVITFDAALEF
jgi:hypothetical protein